jgi:tetratricopeptide (TPR) repeat protein/tRNA A-37 threonylcarbamoyl transferase component Bud32
MMTPPNLPARYSVRSVIGEGGSGRVYRVLDSIRDLELALKLVSPVESTWLRREFDTLRQIRHENLIQVFDWGTLPSGDAYYTMELINGGDWSSRMSAAQAPEEVRRILAGVLRALAHLHSHGEIHGDLKPGNILLGRGGVVKVVDVGMGANVAGGVGSSGTPGYVAPEVWEGSKADERSDLYSVGVLAYEALVGKHPFTGRTVRDVVSGQLEGWVPSPGVHGIRVPADLERAVMRAIDRSPALRHKYADEMLDDLGVKDRTGEILGGRIVGRDQELAGLEAMLRADSPGAPTLVYASGPPGVGKSALLEEFSQRVLGSGGRVAIVPNPPQVGVESALSSLIDGVGPRAEDGFRPGSISSIAPRILDASEREPVVLVFEAQVREDRQSVDFVRNLARYLWALRVERSNRCNLLLAIETEVPPSDAEDFEQNVAIMPLPPYEIANFITGTLGQSALEPEVQARISSVTGGTPGALRALMADLVDRAVLMRRAGQWRFRETEHLHSLSDFGAASRWTLAWAHLSEDRRILLALLAQFSNGLPVESIEATLPGSVDALPDLASRGWTQTSKGRVHIVSGEIFSTINELADQEHLGQVVERLVSLCPDALSREERATVLLAIGSGRVTLEEGFWAAEQSMARGDFRQARKRAEHCIKIAEGRMDDAASRRGALIAAEALHQSAEDERASEFLERTSLWNSDRVAVPDLAKRTHLLGTIRMSQGRMAEAKSNLSHAVELAEESGELSTFLRAHADMAEIDWRHGDGTRRSDAVNRLRAVLGRDFGGLAMNNERAALSYHLGSALILSGDRIGARTILTQALELQPGDFWRMRLANALGTAAYYLGEFQEALDWMNEAWRCAERGGIDAFKARIHSNRAGILYGLGRFKDAVDQHELSAQWGRRTGNIFEFLAACSGSSVNLILLGRYDEAIDQAREAYRAAKKIGGLHDSAKAQELEALAHFYIGAYEEANRLTLLATESLLDKGFDDVKPRLDWLQARLCIVRGDFDGAEALLIRAQEVLLRTKDWEDLPGVQIEMQNLFFQRKDPRFSLQEVMRIALDAERAHALIVYLRGALVTAEVVMADRADDREHSDFLVNALGRAEESGSAEFSWRLSYVIGELARLKADTREATARFAHAVRRLREVADRLNPEHRRSYLQTVHAHCLLERTSQMA